jgi:hypothetical protein
MQLLRNCPLPAARFETTLPAGGIHAAPTDRLTRRSRRCTTAGTA